MKTSSSKILFLLVLTMIPFYGFSNAIESPAPTEENRPHTTTFASNEKSEQKTTATLQIDAIPGTYALILSSYISKKDVERAIKRFKKKYPSLKYQVGYIISEGKYRIGIINLKKLSDTAAYKINLVKDFPEFKDAWPYKVPNE